MTTVDLGDGTLINLTPTGLIGHDLPHPVQRWVVPLIAHEVVDGEIAGAQALGTAFAIAPRVLVTAKHVFDPILREPIDASGTNFALKDNIEPHALLLTREPFPNDASNLGGPVPISGVSITADNDLAVLSTRVFRPAAGVEPSFGTAPLTIIPPAIGSTVTALGYDNPSADHIGMNEAGFPELDIGASFAVSIGTIDEHYHEGRDSRMINFPASQGDFAAFKGMSGGPVVTEDGYVCGVVCSAINPDEYGGGWTSTYAELPSLFPMEIAVDLSSDGDVNKWPIRELAERGIVRTDGTHANVTFEKDADGVTRFRWHYRRP